MTNSRKRANVFVNICIYLVVGVCGFICLVPIMNTFAISFSNSMLVSAGDVTFWPKGWTIEAYRRIVDENQFFLSTWVSIKRVVIGGSINFIMMMIGAFPLAHSSHKFRGRNIYMWIVVFNMLFQGGLVPTYMLVNKLGLIDSIWALVLPGAVPIWNLILLLNFFRSLPKELEEAAEMDGAVPIQILVKLYMPMSLPAIATVMLFSLVGHWNEFFSGLIYVNNMSNYPLATYISQLVTAYNTAGVLDKATNLEELNRLMSISDKTLNSAKILISMVPVLIVYPFLQKYFVKGLVIGAVKE